MLFIRPAGPNLEHLGITRRLTIRTFGSLPTFRNDVQSLGEEKQKYERCIGVYGLSNITALLEACREHDDFDSDYERRKSIMIPRGRLVRG